MSEPSDSIRVKNRFGAILQNYLVTAMDTAAKQISSDVTPPEEVSRLSFVFLCQRVVIVPKPF